MKRILLSTLCCLGAMTISAQQLDWYSLWGSSTEGSHIRPVRMLVDNDNNTYVATSFSGNAVAIGDNSLVSKQGANLGDAALIKMNASNQSLWSITFSEEKQVTISDMAQDTDGNIIVVGTFSGVINPNGQGKLTMYAGEFDDMVLNGFVARFDKAGQLLNQWSIPAFELTSIRVATDSQNNIYVGGTYGSGLFLEGEGSEDKGEYGKDNQYFLAKYAPSGTLTWSKVTTQDGLMVTNATVSVDKKTDDVYFAGTFGGNITLAGKNLTTPGTHTHMFLTKIKSDGTEQWVKQIGGSEDEKREKASEIVISPNGDVALGGVSSSSEMTVSDVATPFTYKHRAGADFGVVTTFSNDGDFRWQYFYGYGDAGAVVVLHSLRCSNEGVYYMAMSSSGRYGDISAGGIIEGKNSGIWSVDGKHFAHNTNGGVDAICAVVSPEGGLVNIMRPGGQQTERLMDVIPTNDKKGVYFLYEFAVRAAIAQIPLNNYSVSFTDINKAKKTGDFTMITVPCPESVVPGGSYTATYAGSFYSACLTYSKFPEINPIELPNYIKGSSYSVDLNLDNKKGTAEFTALSLPTGLVLENNILKGTLEGDGLSYNISLIATDLTPRESYFATYASDVTWDTANPDNLTTRGLNRNVRNYVLKVDNGNSIDSETAKAGNIFASNVISSELEVNTDETSFTVNLYSLVGAKVLTVQNQKTILVNLPAGVYVAEFVAGNNRTAERIIVK